MYLGGYYGYQNSYSNYRDAQGDFNWFTPLVILVFLAAIFFTLSSNLANYDNDIHKISDNDKGIAEYWYSDTSEQANYSPASNTKPRLVHKAAVADKNRIRHSRNNNSNFVKGIFFWI